MAFRLATPAHTPGSAWYDGYEMGMAFCRLTEQLSFQRGTKIEKEIRSLGLVLSRGVFGRYEQERVNVIDLGTGDGNKMLLLIKALNNARVKSIRYVPVDTNPYISRYAILNILGGGRKAWSRREVEMIFGRLATVDFLDSQEGIRIEALVQVCHSRSASSDVVMSNEVTLPVAGLTIDFINDLPQVSDMARSLNPGGKNLYCLLGNTFGNYEAEKRQEFLESLCEEMRPGDSFLLGVSLRPENAAPGSRDVQLIEKEYLPGEVFMRLGADHPRSKFSSKYNSQSFSMIHRFERPDQSIQEMGYSYLFDAVELVDQIESAGFAVLGGECYPSVLGQRSKFAEEPKYFTLLVGKAR